MLGLMACVPQATPVEAPTVVNVAPANHDPPIAEGPVQKIQWSIGITDESYAFNVEQLDVSAFEKIYYSKKAKIVAAVKGSVLRTECSDGTGTLHICLVDGGEVSIGCSDVVLKISCHFKTVNEIKGRE